MPVNDLNPLPLVALLARVGPARERLREALAQAGATVVLEEDPNSVDLETLGGADAGAVLIALEPAIEDALERLDPVLASPSLTVIFDEAELAARREGWEAQRWARHLVAKLHGHQDVLPPGAEQSRPRGASDAQLAEWVANHPKREEVRITAAVLRDGRKEIALRLRSKDVAREVLTGPDLVPGLTDALLATFS